MYGDGEDQDWRPTVGVEVLQFRARLLARIRTYFQAEQVLEVETPLLCGAGVTDPHIPSFGVPATLPGESTRYLTTSPEFAMKRLLAAGSGSIYQVCKAFRRGEAGRLHNPEFTLLEWYRLGFDERQLMDDVTRLVRHAGQGLRDFARVQILGYADCFAQWLGIDPHSAGVTVLKEAAAAQGLGEVVGLDEGDRDGWLDLLFSHCIQPHLGGEGLCFVMDYPASQAALARLKPGTPPVAARFELFIDGVEIANGFHELQDAEEQRRRFEQDLRRRQTQGQAPMPIDTRLLDALGQGLPDCAGVALGLDRLLMVLLRAERLDTVLAFPDGRA